MLRTASDHNTDRLPGKQTIKAFGAIPVPPASSD